MNRRSFFGFLGLLPVAAPAIIEADKESPLPIDDMKYTYRGAVLPAAAWRRINEAPIWRNELFDDIVLYDIDADTAIIDRHGRDRTA